MSPIRAIVEEVERLASRGHFTSAAARLNRAIEEHGPRPWLTQTSEKLHLYNGIPSDPEVVDEDNFASFQTSDAAKHQLTAICDWPPFTPKTPIETDHDVFRAPPPQRPPRRLYAIPDGSLSIDRTRPYRIDFHVFDGSGNYLPELSRGENPFRLKAGVVEVAKPLGFIDDWHTKHNVCHLWFDKLPRVYELQDAVPKLDHFLLLSANNYVSQIAELLDLSLFDLARLNGTLCTIRADTLVISSNSARPAHPGHFCYSHFDTPRRIMAQRLPRPDGPRHRVYVDRAGAETRRLINATEVEKVLQRHGFQSVQLETLTFQEQYTALANAEAVVGVHGAGLANILFCQPGTPVIEILPPRYATPAFWYAAGHCGLPYHPIVASDDGSGAQDEKAIPPARADIWLCPDSLDAHLNRVLPLRPPAPLSP